MKNLLEYKHKNSRKIIGHFVPPLPMEIAELLPDSRCQLVFACYYQRGVTGSDFIILDKSLCKKFGLSNRKTKIRAIEWACERNILTIIKSGKGMPPTVKLNDETFFK